MKSKKIYTIFLILYVLILGGILSAIFFYMPKTENTQQGTILDLVCKKTVNNAKNERDVYWGGAKKDGSGGKTKILLDAQASTLKNTYDKDLGACNTSKADLKRDYDKNLDICNTAKGEYQADLGACNTSKTDLQSRYDTDLDFCNTSKANLQSRYDTDLGACNTSKTDLQTKFYNFLDRIRSNSSYFNLNRVIWSFDGSSFLNVTDFLIIPQGGIPSPSGLTYIGKINNKSYFIELGRYIWSFDGLSFTKTDYNANDNINTATRLSILRDRRNYMGTIDNICYFNGSFIYKFDGTNIVNTWKQITPNGSQDIINGIHGFSNFIISNTFMGVIKDKSYFNAVGKDVVANNEIKNGGIWSFDPTSTDTVPLKPTNLTTDEQINSSSFIGIYENKSYFNLNGNIKVFNGSTIEDKGNVPGLNSSSTYITTINNKSYFKIDNYIYSYNFDNTNFYLVTTLTDDLISISSSQLILST